jgi:hypothetical protein
MSPKIMHLTIDNVLCCLSDERSEEKRMDGRQLTKAEVNEEVAARVFSLGMQERDRHVCVGVRESVCVGVRESVRVRLCVPRVSCVIV